MSDTVEISNNAPVEQVITVPQMVPTPEPVEEVKSRVKATRIVLNEEGEEVKPIETPFERAIEFNSGKSEVFGSEVTEEPISEQPKDLKFNHEDGARLIFGTTTNLLCGLLGPEWKPENKDEAEGVIQPLAAYFKEKGVDDMPIGYVLFFAVGMYSLKRLPQPSTKGRLQFAWMKVKGFVKGFLGRRVEVKDARTEVQVAVPTNGERY